MTDETMQRIRALFKSEPCETSEESVLDIIRQSLRFIHKYPNKREVRIDWSVEENLPLIYLDRLQTQQVFMNLISNAIEAIDESANAAKILLKAFVAQDEGVAVQVINNGTGLKDTEKIFDAFMTTKEQAWILAWPSQNPSLKPTADGYGRRTILTTAPLSMSSCPCRQQVRLASSSTICDLESELKAFLTLLPYAIFKSAQFLAETCNSDCPSGLIR